MMMWTFDRSKKKFFLVIFDRIFNRSIEPLCWKKFFLDPCVRDTDHMCACLQAITCYKHKSYQCKDAHLCPPRPPPPASHSVALFEKDVARSALPSSSMIHIANGSKRLLSVINVPRYSGTDSRITCIF